MTHTNTPTISVVSQHRTSEGIVTWLRESSGALQARFRPYGSTDAQVVAGGRTPPIE